MIEETIEVELPIKIKYNYYPGTSQTKNSPEEPDDIDIINIYLYGEILSYNQQEKFINSYGKRDLDELLIQLAKEEAEDQKINQVI